MNLKKNVYSVEVQNQINNSGLHNNIIFVFFIKHSLSILL